MAQREQDETRVQELKEELSRITQRLQDEQNKLLHQQHTQEKEKEEYARSDIIIIYFLLLKTIQSVIAYLKRSVAHHGSLL